MEHSYHADLLELLWLSDNPLVTQRPRDAADIADNAAFERAQAKLFVRTTKDEGRRLWSV